MKTYWSIDGPNKAPRQPCIAFVKYDGSNIRAEWSRKKGWVKFGTRRRLFDESDEIFGAAKPLFLNKYADDLAAVFKKDKQFRGVQTVTVFGEFFGQQSFAGAHKPNDKEKNIVLFDVNLLKKGLLSPKEFLDKFGHLNVAEVVYRGNLNTEFIESVRNSTIDVESKYDIKTVVPEGVICKGGSGHNLWMCKIKTNEYLQKLKEEYEEDWTKYWE